MVIECAIVPRQEYPMIDTRPVIAHVLHRLYFAGAEVLAAALARDLRERYRFVFICLDDTGPLGEQLKDEGYVVINLYRRPGVDLHVAHRMKQYAYQHDALLLHAHQYTPFFYAAMSRWFVGALRGRPKILFTEHGRHYPDYRRAKRVLANRLLFRPHDRINAVGNHIRNLLVSNEGLAPERIDVIYNGIDPDQFALSRDPAVRAVVRQELGLQPNQPVVMQVARFHPVKDHETGIRAMAHVAQRLPEAVLVLVGDGDERGACEALVRNLDIENNVKFLGVRTDVPRLMSAADVFMLSSLSEGISVTLLEAMAARLPIATTDVGGNPEVVAHNDSGLLSPRGDAQKLGEHLTRLLGDPALRQTMGAAGHVRLLAQFTQQQMHDGYAKVYDEMLA
jgi:glycosyltransferase involved in cell wall biosynthesis